MDDLIHMTAAYSNALLVAVLPHISDFAKKLDLPIPQPITAAQVAKSAPSPFKNSPGDSVFLTNGDWFGIHQFGFVDGYRKRTNYFYVAGDKTDEEIRAYEGPDNMTTNEVIALARQTLIKAGFRPESMIMSQPPTQIDGPTDFTRPEIAGHLPFCQVIWEKKHPFIGLAMVQVNMNTKTVVGLDMNMTGTNRLAATVPLKVDVVPELESDYQRRTGRKLFIDTNAPARFPQQR